ncbi:MAG: hypothetical protein ABEK59_03630 [Halobacteria archaeon]
MFEKYLKKLYTWESLENTDRGVEFELKNRLLDVDIQEITQVKIDDTKIDREDITLFIDGEKEVDLTDFDEYGSVDFELGRTVQFVLDREHLQSGEHSITVGFEVDSYGEVSFTKEETLPGEDGEEFVEDEDLNLKAEPSGFEPPLWGSVERLATKLEESTGIFSKYLPKNKGELEVRINKNVDGALASAFDSKKQFTVYMGVRESNGSLESICDLTGMTPESVSENLDELITEGIVDTYYDGDDKKYEARPPLEAARITGQQVTSSVEDYFLF